MGTCTLIHEFPRRSYRSMVVPPGEAPYDPEITQSDADPQAAPDTSRFTHLDPAGRKGSEVVNQCPGTPEIAAGWIASLESVHCPAMTHVARQAIGPSWENLWLTLVALTPGAGEKVQRRPEPTPR
jgi:hypothetical protein